MADAAEVAIESALLTRLRAMTLSPAVPVSVPNAKFDTPVAGQNVSWLRATLLPADSFALGVGSDSSNQHHGILQVDAFYGQDSGSLPVGRLAASVIQWFRRFTVVTKDGVHVQVVKSPYRGRLVKDDPWVMIPVSVPYLAFAKNPT